MVMPVNELPDHLKRRIPVAGAVLSVVMLAIALWAIVQLFANTRDSYEWVIGANRDVTVAGPCHGDICQGAWEDSATGRVEGQVHVRADLSDLPPRPFFYRGAKVDGENAYLDGSGHRNFDGLVAPLVFLIAALELLRQVALHRRRERRRQEAIRVWRARYEPTF